MKRVAAILLSLMFVWLQVMASAQTNPLQTRSDGSGCNCKTNSCVRAVTTDTQPPPALPGNAAAHTDSSLFARALVTWTLPGTGPSLISSSDSTPLSALAVPLFTRYCARLI